MNPQERSMCLTIATFLLLLMALISPTLAYTEVFVVTHQPCDVLYYVGNRDADFFIAKRNQNCEPLCSSSSGSTEGDGGSDGNNEILRDILIGNDGLLYAAGSTKRNFSFPELKSANLDALILVYHSEKSSVVLRSEYDMPANIDNAGQSIVQKPDGTLLLALYSFISSDGFFAFTDARLLGINPATLETSETHGIEIILQQAFGSTGGPKMADMIYEGSSNLVVILGHVLGNGVVFRYDLATETMIAQEEWSHVFQSTEVNEFTSDGSGGLYVVGSSNENVLENGDLVNPVSTEMHACVIYFDALSSTKNGVWVRQLATGGSTKTGKAVDIDPVTGQVVVIGNFIRDFAFVDTQTGTTFNVRALNEGGLSDVFLRYLDPDSGKTEVLRLASTSTQSADKANAVVVFVSQGIEIRGAICEELNFPSTRPTYSVTPSPLITLSSTLTSSFTISQSITSSITPSASATPSPLLPEEGHREISLELMTSSVSSFVVLSPEGTPIVDSLQPRLSPLAPCTSSPLAYTQDATAVSPESVTERQSIHPTHISQSLLPTSTFTVNLPKRAHSAFVQQTPGDTAATEHTPPTDAQPSQFSPVRGVHSPKETRHSKPPQSTPHHDSTDPTDPADWIISLKAAFIPISIVKAGSMEPDAALMQQSPGSVSTSNGAVVEGTSILFFSDVPVVIYAHCYTSSIVTYASLLVVLFHSPDSTMTEDNIFSMELSDDPRIIGVPYYISSIIADTFPPAVLSQSPGNAATKEIAFSMEPSNAPEVIHVPFYSNPTTLDAFPPALLSPLPVSIYQPQLTDATIAYLSQADALLEKVTQAATEVGWEMHSRDAQSSQKKLKEETVDDDINLQQYFVPSLPSFKESMSGILLIVSFELSAHAEACIGSSNKAMSAVRLSTGPTTSSTSVEQILADDDSMKSIAPQTPIVESAAAPLQIESSTAPNDFFLKYSTELHEFGDTPKASIPSRSPDAVQVTGIPNLVDETPSIKDHGASEGLLCPLADAALAGELLRKSPFQEVNERIAKPQTFHHLWSLALQTSGRPPTSSTRFHHLRLLVALLTFSAALLNYLLQIQLRNTMRRFTTLTQNKHPHHISAIVLTHQSNCY